VPVPDLARGAEKPVEVIGIAGRRGREIGGIEGLGPRGRDWVIFEPLPEEARRVVYVVDRSGSMTETLRFVKLELRRALEALGPQHQFHVIFYNAGPPLEMPSRRLVAATEANRDRALAFIDTVIAEGETDPSGALERAFRVRPEVVYLLTDGEFDRAVVDLVRRLNAGGGVRVSTIGFLTRSGEDVLRAIAETTGGAYRHVTEEDLGLLAR
jgi:hypothetical protein